MCGCHAACGAGSVAQSVCPKRKQDKDRAYDDFLCFRGESFFVRVFARCDGVKSSNNNLFISVSCLSYLIISFI